MQPLTIGIVAGEASGDALGADFMQQMNALCPHVRWVGVGGKAMIQAGLTSLFDYQRLAVMGIAEVVTHLPDLLSAKQEILSAFAQANIDIFVGIDAPDFNLRLGKALKKRLGKSVFCVQYVSPSVWAWREGRIHTIKNATDLVLCLFPFELAVYQKHQHPAVCVGHPLLKQIQPSQLPPNQSQSNINNRPNHQQFLSQFGKIAGPTARPICIMAGSRLSEIKAMLGTLIDAMSQLSNRGDFVYLLPVVSAEHTTLIGNTLQTQAPALLDKTHIIIADVASSPTISQQAMSASELVILASGTATLEALLLHRPMVVIYKVSPLTYHIAKRLLKIPYYSLPNILSCHQRGQPIVPELIQQNANATNIVKHALGILKDWDNVKQQLVNTDTLLRQDSHTNPAQAVLSHFAH